MTCILLADDHILFRHGIRQPLSAEPGVTVVGEADNGAEAISEVTRVRQHVVLMDIGMPGLSSFAATRHIKRHWPETKILFLSMYDHDDYL